MNRVNDLSIRVNLADNTFLRRLQLRRSRSSDLDDRVGLRIELLDQPVCQLLLLTELVANEQLLNAFSHFERRGFLQYAEAVPNHLGLQEGVLIVPDYLVKPGLRDEYGTLHTHLVTIPYINGFQVGVMQGIPEDFLVALLLTGFRRQLEGADSFNGETDIIL